MSQYNTIVTLFARSSMSCEVFFLRMRATAARQALAVIMTTFADRTRNYRIGDIEEDDLDMSRSITYLRRAGIVGG